MPVNFDNFTKTATINGTDRFVGYFNASLGGERSWQFSDLKNSIFGGTQAANTISLWTNSTQRVIINASGNVGIGQPTPSLPLEVSGKSKFSTNLSNVLQIVGTGVGYADASNGVATIYSENTSGSGGNVLKVGSAFAPNGLIVKDTGAVTISSLGSGIIKSTSGLLSVATAGTDYQAAITGAASTVTSSNLDLSRALVSNGTGKIAASTISATELGYLTGVTSNIQTQLNANNSRFVKAHYYTNNTRQVTTSQVTLTYFTFNIYKQSATSNLFFHVVIPFWSADNSGLYIGVGIDGVYDYAGMVKNANSEGNVLVINQRRASIGSAVRTITIRQASANSNSQRPINVINPNANDDARNRQSESTVIIYEIEP